MSAELFPPSPQDHLAYLKAFVTTERRHREHMLASRPAQTEYWAGRVADADEALRHIEQLRESAEHSEQGAVS